MGPAAWLLEESGIGWARAPDMPNALTRSAILMTRCIDILFTDRREERTTPFLVRIEYMVKNHPIGKSRRPLRRFAALTGGLRWISVYFA
jgi:hypothetical protein